jgi:hypothetical protein
MEKYKSLFNRYEELSEERGELLYSGKDRDEKRISELDIQCLELAIEMEKVLQ